jgi:YkoY family integral membrane protein
MRGSIMDPLVVTAAAPAGILQDAATVATLIVLEGLLSADNALVLAVMVRHLPKGQQGRALRYGIVGAFVFRGIALVLATYLIHFWYIKAAGAAYLLRLCIVHFWHKLKFGGGHEAYEIKVRSFWRTVVAVELTDVAFSVDSIVAAVALSNKLWVVYLGGILGIITMRYVAQGFIALLDRFSALESSAYLLVGWIGLKLGWEVYDQQMNPEAYKAALDAHQHYGGMPPWIFWTVMVVLFLGAFAFKRKPKPEQQQKEESAEHVESQHPPREN